MNVLELLRKIPRGKVTTYKELAKATRLHPRTIGVVMRRNADPARYPCYKVVSSSGRLGGYSGGVRRKAALLRKDGVKIVDGKVDLGKHLFRF